MKITYNNSPNLFYIKEKLEKVSCNPNETIRIEGKKNELFLVIDESRIETRYKISISDKCIELKYSGFLSYMNIIIGIILGIVPIVMALLLTGFMILTQDVDTKIIIGLSAGIVTGAGFLWSLMLKHRIKAKQYIKKILGC